MGLSSLQAEESQTQAAWHLGIPCCRDGHDIPAGPPECQRNAFADPDHFLSVPGRPAICSSQNGNNPRFWTALRSLGIIHGGWLRSAVGRLFAGASMLDVFQFLFRETYPSLIALAVLSAILVGVGVYVIGKVRKSAVTKGPSVSQYMTNFQELHAKGELSDAEYRTIKAVLTERMQQELKDTGEPG